MSSPRTLILPNRNTLGLGAVLTAMWYAGASQNNGAAYLLCFVLASVAAVSALHAWLNLRGCTLSAAPVHPVFEGEQLAVPLELRAARGRRHAAIRVRAGGAAATFDEATADAPRRATLYAAARARGRFAEISVVASSVFPLGFFTASRRMNLPQTHFIYPKPAGALPLPTAFDPAQTLHAGARPEGDDFAGLREWRSGESMRHVHWKAVARGQPLMTKQWSGENGDLFSLQWEATVGLAHEDRLRQLAQWVVLAERTGAAYALHLPGTAIPAGRGEGHFHQCLRALAAFPREGGAPGGG
jgi:uncharacterized protein (DUF58 family)